MPAFVSPGALPRRHNRFRSTPSRLLRAGVLAAFAALAAGFLLPGAAEARSLGDRVLSTGSRGADVRELQRGLTTLGFNTRVDGSYGRATARSVRAYRRDRRLTVRSDVTRPLGRRISREVRAAGGVADVDRIGRRVLRRGLSGSDVRALQRALTRLRIHVPASGWYGHSTEAAVKRFQRAEGVSVTGRVASAHARRIREHVTRSASSSLAQRSVPEPDERPVYVGASRHAELTYTATGAGTVAIEVEDVEAGRVVARIADEAEGPGERTVRWNGRGSSGPVPEGVYRLRLVGGPASQEAGDAFRLYHHVFPVRGRHDYGGRHARFGTSRGRMHYGQDVFARCGTRLASASAGRVTTRRSHGAAGHYVVIRGDATGLDYVYMHLQRQARVRPGQRVRAGETIGYVGRTGNATACHLHFELWTSPGWYEGGRAFNPLPDLREWSAQ